MVDTSIEMIEVAPETIKVGQEIMVVWKNGPEDTRMDTIVVGSIKKCSASDIFLCKGLNMVCCKHLLVSATDEVWRFCTRNSDRCFYLVVDTSKINRITEVE